MEAGRTCDAAEGENTNHIGIANAVTWGRKEHLCTVSEKQNMLVECPSIALKTLMGTSRVLSFFCRRAF